MGHVSVQSGRGLRGLSWRVIKSIFMELLSSQLVCAMFKAVENLWIWAEVNLQSFSSRSKNTGSAPML